VHLLYADVTNVIGFLASDQAGDACHRWPYHALSQRDHDMPLASVPFWLLTVWPRRTTLEAPRQNFSDARWLLVQGLQKAQKR
jgi:hypothetical protein